MVLAASGPAEKGGIFLGGECLAASGVVGNGGSLILL